MLRGPVRAVELIERGELTPRRRSPASRLSPYYFRCAAVLICLVSLAVFFHQFLKSGFNIIASDDIGDNRFLIAILEHWRAVAHGRASLASPNFFWPAPGVLGYSEAVFLFNLPYALARAAGMDIYLAFGLTLIVLKAAGFFSMLWLLRSFVRVSRIVAITGSCLFTISNMYALDVHYAQLMSVALIPLLACFACAGWHAYGAERKLAGCVYGASFGFLLGLLLYTSFYIGWFALFAGAVTLLTVVASAAIRTRAVSPFRQWMRITAARGPMLCAAALAFSLAMVPFIITYMPKLKETGGRGSQEWVIFDAHPADLINVWVTNWMWGRGLNAMMLRLAGRPLKAPEYSLGWPPITLGLVAAGLALGLRGKTRPGVSALRSVNQRDLAVVISASFFICWASSVIFRGRSLWWYIYKFVPGASAIRVPERLNLVTNVMAVIVVCIILNQLQQLRGRGSKIIFGALSVLLIAEQINTAPIFTMRRDMENAILMRAHRPPPTCAAFFLTHPAYPDRGFQANQEDAMLIARMYDIPTLNGYSGWTPPGWELLRFDKDYLQNVRRWAMRKRVTPGLCGLDLRDGSWTPAQFEERFTGAGSGSPRSSRSSAAARPPASD